VFVVAACLAAITGAATLPGCSSEEPDAKSKKADDKKADDKTTAVKRAPINHKKFEIDRVDASRYVLDDEAVSQLLLDGIAGQIHVTRVNRGYRLDGYADDTLVKKLGLEKGDVVVTINDAILTDMHQARVAFAKARKDGSFRLAIDRKGTSLQRRYFLRRMLDGQNYRSYRRRYRKRRRSYSKTEYAFEKVLTSMRTGIKRVTDTHVQIDRAILTVLQDNDELLKDGLTYIGLDKGYGIEDEYSVYKELSLTKYDGVTQINGVDTTSRRSIRRVLAGQASAKEFTITVKRLNDPMTIRYQVVENTADKKALTTAVEEWRGHSKSKYDPFAKYKPTAPKTPTTSLLGAPKLNVKKLSTNTYELSYLEMKGFWTNPLVHARGARIVPSVRSGKTDGFKLFAIRPNTAWSALGFKNGDTIQVVNSVVMDSAMKMLGIGKTITAGLKTMTIQIRRRGRQSVLTYHLK